MREITIASITHHCHTSSNNRASYEEGGCNKVVTGYNERLQSVLRLLYLYIHLGISKQIIILDLVHAVFLYKRLQRACFLEFSYSGILIEPMN